MTQIIPVQPAGTLINVKEVRAGHYEVTWAYSAGTHRIDISVLDRLVAWGLRVNISVVYKEGEVSGGSADFVRDNKDGTATLLVGVLDYKNNPNTGLTSSAFKVGPHNPDNPNKPVQPFGTLIEVMEVSDGNFELIWAYSTGNHSVDISVLDRLVAWGLEVTITASGNTKVVLNEDADVPIEFYDGKIKMQVNTEEVVFVVGATFYDEAEEKGTPENMVPVNIFLSLERSENIDGDLVRVFVYYDPTEIPDDIDVITLKLYKYNPTTESWELVPEQGISVENNYLWMDVTNFSNFGVFGNVIVADPIEDANNNPETLLKTMRNNWSYLLGLLFLVIGALILKKKVSASKQN